MFGLFFRAVSFPFLPTLVSSSSRPCVDLRSSNLASPWQADQSAVRKGPESRVYDLAFMVAFIIIVSSLQDCRYLLFALQMYDGKSVSRGYQSRTEKWGYFSGHIAFNCIFVKLIVFSN